MITLPFFGSGGGGGGRNWKFQSNMDNYWCWFNTNGNTKSSNFATLGLATVESNQTTTDDGTSKYKITIKKNCLFAVGEEEYHPKVAKYNKTTKKYEILVSFLSIGPDYTDAYGSTYLYYEVSVPILGTSGDIFLTFSATDVFTFFQLF